MIAADQNNIVTLNSPCVLPLGAIKDKGRPALLGLTLLYPPVNLVIKRLNELSVTGARAPVARARALHWFEDRQQTPKAEIEIELAIPVQMGLGSEALLGLSVARGLEYLIGSGNPPSVGEEARSAGLGAEWLLEGHCFSQGGIQVVGADGRPLRRQSIQHDDRTAWVFVIYMPRTPAGATDDLEASRRRALLEAARHTQADIEPLWNAMIADDAVAFARELMAIQQQTKEALDSNGAASEAVEEADRILEAIRQTGGLAWGQSQGGRAIWGLQKGASPSQETRIAMRRVVGYEGGTVTAAVTDNAGVKVSRG